MFVIYFFCIYVFTGVWSLGFFGGEGWLGFFGKSWGYGVVLGREGVVFIGLDLLFIGGLVFFGFRSCSVFCFGY